MANWFIASFQLCAAAPIGSDVAQCQPDQLAGDVVIGEVAMRRDDFAQLRIDAFDGVGRVDHPAHRWWERKEWDHVIPEAAPGHSDRGELLAPRSMFEGLQLGLRSFGACCRVDRLDGGRQQLTVLPAGVVQTDTDQVHDAGLQRGGREYGAQSFRHPFESIGDSDQDVVHAPGLQVVDELPATS